MGKAILRIVARLLLTFVLLEVIGLTQMALLYLFHDDIAGSSPTNPVFLGYGMASLIVTIAALWWPWTAPVTARINRFGQFLKVIVRALGLIKKENSRV